MQNDSQKDKRTITDFTPPKYGVMLPCAPDEFGQFVSGLLGKPQTIEKSFRGIFELTRDDVTNTYHLVNQRIHQQNEATLLQFTVKIIYDDDSSVLLNSLDDFSHFTEIRPLKSIGVTLSWTYLVRFRQKKAPEKQQIDLTFRADGLDYFESVIVEDGVVMHRPSRRFRPAGLFLRINHTERTWGIDIESLLTGHVKTLMKKPDATAEFIYRKSGNIGFAVGALFFIGSIIGVFFTTNSFIASYLKKVNALNVGLTNSADMLIKKIDFLAQIISAGVWPRFIFSIIAFIVIALILSIFLGSWVSEKADNRPHSFVLLSKAAEDYKEFIKSKRKRDWVLFAVSILTSIITGVIANIIFSTYFGKL